MKLSKPVLFTLIGSLLVILYLFVFAGPKKTLVSIPVGKKDEQKLTETMATKDKDKQEEQIKKISQMDANWAKDPFLLPKITDAKQDVSQTPLKLTGIIEGRDGRYAIVDTNIVKKGDFIGDEMVLDIEKDRIILTRKGKKKTISVSDITREDGVKASSPEGKR